MSHGSFHSCVGRFHCMANKTWSAPTCLLYPTSVGTLKPQITNTCMCYRPLSKSCNAWDWPAGSLSKALTEKSLSSRRYVYNWNITEPTTQSKTLMQIIHGTGCSKQCLSSWLCQLEGSGHASKIVVHPWLSKPVFNWGVDCTPQFGSLIKLKSEPHKAEVIFLNVGCRANWTRQTAVAAAG